MNDNPYAAPQENDRPGYSMFFQITVLLGGIVVLLAFILIGVIACQIIIVRLGWPELIGAFAIVLGLAAGVYAAFDIWEPLFEPIQQVSNVDQPQ